jgi:hypothetical protein
MSLNVTQAKAKIREITGANTSDYSDASLIRDLNSELSLIRAGIIRDRGVLEHDDPNFSDLQFATFPITAGVRSYKITEDDNGAEIITKHKVAILYDGKYHDVPRIPVAEGSQDGLLTSSENTRYIPTGYHEAGDSIIFTEFPKEDTTGQVWFDRALNELTTSDTVKVLGVPGQYHNLACYKTALNYAIDKGLKNEGSIERRVIMEEERLQEFETSRRSDEPVVITPIRLSGL